ncbi:glycine--tRNA ligase [Candidatus Peregrinibacteria bacterium]|jgi:glycyl-tRNA synthetase|nr:glycine--tRNA ligase [Candidatus Peregrinibacteria bacterium]MBT4631562.1 glycine--tRNA ligase [Candidatus Peregrinibacteria bacterium]MBT5517225.1 glycine--tRNA ligase [Candidatus Peregrinibacteria bacterium]MBT5823547.1 glycine--tRNA ligase [Candidatus Peregrinibacteria bacterium]
MGLMEDVMALCKRRGFVYAGSDIYGGLANTWDYGPYGSQLKKNILDYWWKTFVENRDDMIGLDSAILMNPRVWEASGHISNFSDPLMDCKNCKERVRADKLIEEKLNESVEGQSNEEIFAKVMDSKLECPSCSKVEWTEPRAFNLMFKTYQGVIEDTAAQVYLRPETAQGIFVNFKNITDSTRMRLPFGVGQYGKSFRNEITPGNFIFRTREFEQLEIEYFVHPDDADAKFDEWVEMYENFFKSLGVRSEKLKIRAHADKELSHYSTKTVDFEYEYPFGWGELMGVANRGCFDLNQHAEFSGKKLEYRDPITNEVFVPHVVEPALGLTRALLVLLLEAYEEEELEGGESRTVMHFDPKIAPVQVAVFPLQKKLSEDAIKVYRDLKTFFRAEFDESGAIGKRYRRQDEIGTPFCVTFDFDSQEDGSVTVRERDSMSQERVKIEDLRTYIMDKIWA